MSAVGGAGERRHRGLAPTSPAGCAKETWVGVSRRPKEERRRLLQGTGVPEAVEKDLAGIRSEYSSIVLPFMEAHPDLFSPRVRSLELYQQLVALVMAYRSACSPLKGPFLQNCIEGRGGKNCEPHRPPGAHYNGH